MVYLRDGSRLTNTGERNSIMTIATAAYCGFRELGEGVEWFSDRDAIAPGREDIVVGSVRDMQMIFSRFGVTLPVIEYPSELTPYFGRRLWTEPSLRRLIGEGRTNIFIKPAAGMKLFNGRVIRTENDYGRLSFTEDCAVLCSEVVDIHSEWRCYVRHGRLLAIKHYCGDPFLMPDRTFVDRVIAAYTTAPAGYAVDIGVTETAEGRSNLVVEVNDGYSLGVYGIFPLPYAKLLASRYAQLMGFADPYYEPWRNGE